jgi:hypothetical protein
LRRREGARLYRIPSINRIPIWKILAKEPRRIIFGISCRFRPMNSCVTAIYQRMKNSEVVRHNRSIAACQESEIERVDGFPENSSVTNCFHAFEALFAENPALDVTNNHEYRPFILPVEIHRSFVVIKWELENVETSSRQEIDKGKQQLTLSSAVMYTPTKFTSISLDASTSCIVFVTNISWLTSSRTSRLKLREERNFLI